MTAELEHLHLELTTYKAGEEERWDVRKKAFVDYNEFHDIVGAYSVVLFKHEFEGIMKQFKAKGYPLEGVVDSFLNPFKVLSELP